MVQEDSNAVSGNVIAPWNPVQYVREVDPLSVRYSRGFLRCRPERWFPGFAAQWLPLAHSLGAELRCLEVKPVVAAPRGHEYGFSASVDDEPIAIEFDEAAANVLANGLVPNGKPAARQAALEYLTRRFVQSLALAWSSSQSSVVLFEPSIDSNTVRETGGIKITATLNGNQFVVWVLLGKILVERFDGLWRRQLLANAQQRSGEVRLGLELAHLTVPPTSIADYLQPGTDIDLEVPAGDKAVLLVDSEPAFQVRLLRTSEVFAFEILPGAVPPQQLPEGTSRLSIQLSSLSVRPELLAELSQPNAMLDTPKALDDVATLCVGADAVGTARLRVYQGRLAITVL